MSAHGAARVGGANDKLSPPAKADRFNSAISGSREVLIDKAGHYPFIEHLDRAVFFEAAVVTKRAPLQHR